MLVISSKTCPNPRPAPLFHEICSITETPIAAAQSDLKTAEIAKELLCPMMLAGVFFFVLPPILSGVTRSIESALIALNTK